MPSIDIGGQRFGRLVVVALACNKPRRWKCECDCGQKRLVIQYNLTSGKTVSCGCFNRDRMTTHGQSRTNTYSIWATMIARCHDSGSKDYPVYGAAGISVCKRWRESYPNFLADMGARPSKQHSLDRYPNVRGNYEPGNVRWATNKQQNVNRRNTVRVTLGGQTKPLTEWCELRGINYNTAYHRIFMAGWSPDRALKGAL